MPLFNFWRRDRRDPGDQRSGAIRPASLPIGVPIRDAERRRLSRLMARRSNIEHDLSQAESAFLPRNRWTDRLDQLEAAIRQANEDVERLRPARAALPVVELPSTPIKIDILSVDPPAEIVLRALSGKLVFREELDWAERGHQLALPELAQVEGDVADLIPDDLPHDLERRLSVHLRNCFSIIASEALRSAADNEPVREFRLEELVRPCAECGGWLDPLGRCSTCAELSWQRNQIASAAARLVDERNEVMADLDRTRERLPVFRRQLQDAQRDIEELRSKGIEPS